MRVALYARYSSEGQRETSITDQFRNCETYAARQQSWDVTHRYQDKAISGTKDANGRPGYKQMLADAKANMFDVVLVDDFSRLSRDTIEAERARRRFVHWGVRLIGVSDGIDTAQEGHELLSGVKSLVNQTFIKDIRGKIKRGMVGQAERCFWNGGRVYGYRLVPVLDSTKLDCYGNPAKIGTRLEKDHDQAKWIKWIFEQYVNGRSPWNIVTELNARGVPPPGAAYKRDYHRPPTWSAAALHGELQRGTGLLNNQLYRGLYRWNRSYRVTDPDDNTETNRWRDQREWITREIKELRIIDEDLWERAHRKRVAVSQTAQALNASSGSRGAGTGRRPKYLFSGLLTCGQCGSNMVIHSATDYACSLWRTRGATKNTCTNSLTVKRTTVESLLLKAIQEDLFTEEGLEVFKEEFERYLLEQRKAKTSDKEHTHRRLSEVQAEIDNIMAALKAGIITSTTKEMLLQAEAERDCLRQVLEVPANKLDKLTTALPNLVDRFQRMLEDLARATRYEIDKARGILHGLVGEKKIVLRPTADRAGNYLTAELAGDYAGLIPLIFQGKIKLVAVTRIERVTRGL
jgi:DNA invertase Pin-like site-specific DNA recombinase